jgi:1,2-dihydroxy-3-keto-5-methylthiopentene dioxygenase
LPAWRRDVAIVSIPDENKNLTEEAEIRRHLAGIGVGYERWEPAHAVAEDAPPEEILAAYAAEIGRLKERGGYSTADVIDVSPHTPGLNEMLAKFKREHRHDEDEVRFIIQGRGLFHLHPEGGPVTCVEVEPGDLLSVPRGMRHWFGLCSDRRIRAIRLFQDTAGWTPQYTDSGAELAYEPVCLGASYAPIQASTVPA